MSLKKNILANYISQIYVTLIGIMMVPLYIKYMGAEAYGLVGFFAMMLAWFTLLDMGMTPMIARETARYHGGATDASNFRRLVRALEGVFLLLALFGGAGLFAASSYLSHNWLKASALPMSELEASLQLMAFIISLRWLCGLYRSVISGSERLVWLSGYNLIIATFRFIVIFPVLIFIGATPTVFFSFQLGIAILEFLGLIIYAYRLLPSFPIGQRLSWEWAPLKPALKFSATIAFTSSVWVLVTQTDKLVLSKILPLQDYGYFTLAVLVANGIMLFSGPISSAIMPRMAKLEAEGKHEETIKVYRQATQFIAVLTGSVALVVAFFSESLLWVWTGDIKLAQQVAPMLSLYALGNAVLAVAAFPYYLQYAKGDLHLHLIGNAIFVTLLIPTIIWGASIYGGVGAGYVWLGMNLLSFVVWLPLVHNKFVPGLNLRWYGQDVLIIFLPIMIVGYGLSGRMPFGESRGLQLAEIMLNGLIMLSVGLLASSEIRVILAEKIKLICKDKVLNK